MCLACARRGGGGRSRAGVALVPSAAAGARRASPGGRERGRGRPGGAGRLGCTSHTLCFVCFSLPRSRFLQCGGRRDHKGLTHIFNPPPKSKWPVWCLLHPPPPSPCPFLCLTRTSPALLFPGLCFGAAAVWGNALSSSSVPHAQSSGRPGIPAPRFGGARSWESDLPQQNLGDSVRPLGPLVPSFLTGFRWKELCKSCFLVSIQRQFHAVRSSLCCARGRTDTDLIDISVGGKGGGGVEKLNLEELQHLVSSVFVFEPSGLTGGSALYNVPQGMFSIIDEKAKLKL